MLFIFSIQMGDIVTEQWIQVQHLEQALHITKVCEVHFLVYKFLQTFTSSLYFVHVFFELLIYFLFAYVCVCKDEDSKGSKASENKMHILEGNFKCFR